MFYFQVENKLEDLVNASSNAEIIEKFNDFQRNTNELIAKAIKRQNELRDPKLRDELAAARAVFAKSSAMLFTASKVN